MTIKELILQLQEIENSLTVGDVKEVYVETEEGFYVPHIYLDCVGNVRISQGDRVENEH